MIEFFEVTNFKENSLYVSDNCSLNLSFLTLKNGFIFEEVYIYANKKNIISLSFMIGANLGSFAKILKNSLLRSSNENNILIAKIFLENIKLNKIFYLSFKTFAQIKFLLIKNLKGGFCIINKFNPSFYFSYVIIEEINEYESNPEIFEIYSDNSYIKGKKIFFKNLRGINTFLTVWINQMFL